MITEPAIAIIGGSGLYDMHGAKKSMNTKLKRLSDFHLI